MKDYIEGMEYTFKTFRKPIGYMMAYYEQYDDWKPMEMAGDFIRLEAGETITIEIDSDNNNYRLVDTECQT